MRSFIGIVLLGTLLLGDQNLDTAIKQNKARMQNKIAEQNRIGKKLKELGLQIETQNKELKSLVDEIQILEKEIEDNQGRFLEEEKEFQAISSKNQELHKQSEEIQSQITKLIAQELAFRVIVTDKQPSSSEDIILSELFKTLSKNAQVNIISLAQEKQKVEQEIKQISGRLKSLQTVIAGQNKKRKKLEEGIGKRNTLLARLEKDRKVYDERFSKLAQERENLDQILERLNIRKQREKKEKGDVESGSLADSKVPLDVRRMGSSYSQVSTMRYRGKKTISPLDRYDVEQRFGTYFDPVYKIKVFNKSVILSPKQSNANVKNVLDGKVVFAKDTPMLKKVVIIEHANQTHTIYAHLDKIAPTIRPGLRIKKGYIIGKVNERLSFEVTQKDKHIDPLEMIKKN